MVIIPSVTMKELIFALATSKPLINPMSAPATTASGNAQPITQVFFEPETNDRGKGDDGTDGQVELAADEYDGEADGDGGIHRHGSHDRREVPGIEESWGENRHDQENHDKKYEDSVPVTHG
jgi:hypothetical protein